VVLSVEDDENDNLKHYYNAIEARSCDAISAAFSTLISDQVPFLGRVSLFKSRLGDFFDSGSKARCRVLKERRRADNDSRLLRMVSNQYDGLRFRRERSMMLSTSR
jgi:hypothetical protein